MLKELKIPDSYNYVGVFLTFNCSLGCSYCINNFENKVKNRPQIRGKDWVDCLNRLASRPDLPVTLQGGEPTVHPDFFYIINNIKPELNIDVLTNLEFDIDDFMSKVGPNRIKRDAPYASIRVSYHPEKMKLDELLPKVLKMLDNGYSLGIWSVLHPAYEKHIKEAQELAQSQGIDFRFKEFLGEYEGKLYGTYKYDDACSKQTKKNVTCKTTEFLIDPGAKVFKCHHDLYKDKDSIGKLSDPNFKIKEIYWPCDSYGFCNPCDIKVKTNRFQQFGHTSVDIKFGE